MSRAILKIRKKAVSFEEGKQLFGDNGFHSLRDKRSDSNSVIVSRVRFVPFLEIGKMCASFQEEENIPGLWESWKSLLRTWASSGAQDFRTIPGIPSGPLDFEALS